MISRSVTITRQEAKLESFVWILGPVVVAFFGFLFWLVMGRLGQDDSKDEEAKDGSTKPAENADE